MRHRNRGIHLTGRCPSPTSRVVVALGVGAPAGGTSPNTVKLGQPGAPMLSSMSATVRPSTPGVREPWLPATRDRCSLDEGGARLCPSDLVTGTPQTFPVTSQDGLGIPS